MTIVSDRNLLAGLTSWGFRRAASDHNAEHGRFLSWADARVMWHAARAAALAHVNQKVEKA